MSRLPDTMAGVGETGYGGIDRLDYRDDLPVPTPDRDEVVVNVRAAGMNNTDINTRTGWCAIEVTPQRDFITYGIGVSLWAMRSPDRSRARVPVDADHERTRSGP